MCDNTLRDQNTKPSPAPPTWGAEKNQWTKHTYFNIPTPYKCMSFGIFTDILSPPYLSPPSWRLGPGPAAAALLATLGHEAQGSHGLYQVAATG